MENINQLLEAAVYYGASDLHLAKDSAPIIRVHGNLHLMGDKDLTDNEVKEMIYDITNPTQFQHLMNTGQLDFSHAINDGKIRVRINAYKKLGSLGMAIRVLPNRIPSMQDINLPSVIQDVTCSHQGLFIVTGPTGSGKSTTLATMIDWINKNYSKHIITLEDPIEYIYSQGSCVISQREVGKDTDNFEVGLKAAMRQDPDIILVGEIRSLESLHTALAASDTGHFVLGTMHTIGAYETVERILSMYSYNEREQVRLQLASNLIGVISQRLLPRSDKEGRVAAHEILINTPEVSDLIRNNKIHEVRSLMKSNKHGMKTLGQSLKQLIDENKINAKLAEQYIPKYNWDESV